MPERVALASALASAFAALALALVLASHLVRMVPCISLESMQVKQSLLFSSTVLASAMERNLAEEDYDIHGLVGFSERS